MQKQRRVCGKCRNLPDAGERTDGILCPVRVVLVGLDHDYSFHDCWRSADDEED